VKDFVRCLLEEDPKRRMTLTNALHHPWLKSYTLVYDHGSSDFANFVPTDNYSMLYSIPESYDSSSVNQGFQNMQIQPDASTSSIPGFHLSRPAGIEREDSRVTPLQRRSHVLSQAVEEGKPLVEPTSEMIAKAAAQEEQVAGPSNSNGKGQNKRVHSELTPLSEEASMDISADGSSPLGEASSHKGKGRVADAIASPAKARNQRTRAGKGNGGGEDEAVQPRRSGRHPPKVARRG
jgi:serine/threonine/tyrosine protein kinase RAD53